MWRMHGKQTPAVELTVRRALHSEWRHFREHHYKGHSLNGSSICFVGVLNARVVAFLAVVHTGCTLVRMFRTYNLDKLRVDMSLSKACCYS